MNQSKPDQFSAPVLLFITLKSWLDVIHVYWQNPLLWEECRAPVWYMTLSNDSFISYVAIYDYSVSVGL